MKKKSLSSVIATLFLILFALMLIVIIWIVVSSVISEKSTTTKIQTEFFGEDIRFMKIQTDPLDGLKLNTSIRTSSGSLKVNTLNIPAPPSEIDIVSVVDVSGSMRDCLGMTNHSCTCAGPTSTLHGSVSGSHCYSIPSAYINRCFLTCGGTLHDGLNSSQDANKQLINTIFKKPTDNNRIGLVAYNTSLVDKFSCNPTNDNLSLRTIINSWEALGNTCICCGINKAKDMLLSSPNERQKAIIVMSDGEANVICSQQGTGNAKRDANKSACQAFQQLSNLTIYTVGLGGGVDQITMQNIAQCGNGTYFSASEISNLTNIYQAIADQIIQTSRAFYKFVYLKIIFYDSTGKTIMIKIDVPSPLETETYEFNLNGQGLIAPIVKIEIYPVILSPQGKEVIGPLFDSWEKK